MISWAYLAGFVDCDGWITKSKGWTVGLTQSHLFAEQMRVIAKFLSDNNIHHSYIERDANTMIRGAKSISKMINIHVKEQQSLKILLTNIMPHLLIKKDKAEKCLEWVKDRLYKRGVNIEISNTIKRRSWDSQDIEKLKLLRQQGCSARTIASILNRSAISISKKVHRLDIPRTALDYDK